MQDDRFEVDAAVAALLPPEDAQRVGPRVIVCGAEGLSREDRGRLAEWIVEELARDALATGIGAARVTAEGVERIAPAELRANRCYGCNRVEAPAGWVGSYYCGGCAEWDAYTSDPGDDVEPEE